MRIVNLTQHAPSQEQVEAGVFQPESHEFVKRQLTFDTIPTREEIMDRAEELAILAAANNADAAMIGGAPFFMESLEAALASWDVQPLYAFSQRESVEVKEPDGSVRKVAVFRHQGFVEGKKAHR